MVSLRHFHLYVLYSLMLFIYSDDVSCASDGKVSVDLYYETLCPASAEFIVKDLSKIFTNGLIEIINLNLVPYGNAMSYNGSIACQHGPDECLLNTVEACGINIWPDVKQHFTFVECIENLVSMGRSRDWRKCTGNGATGFDPETLSDCYNGVKGKQLDIQYADETNNLKPPHEYVPWVVVKGEPLKLNNQDFMVYVCKAYEGNPAPKACKDMTIGTQEKNFREVCHVEKAKHQSSGSTK